jgi:hypothetical protein
VTATNRLAGETSPYLRQHAHNPVDWYPWGEEAFAEAKRRDVPILLSVGYSACHWCHVAYTQRSQLKKTTKMRLTQGLSGPDRAAPDRPLSVFSRINLSNSSVCSWRTRSCDVSRRPGHGLAFA